MVVENRHIVIVDTDIDEKYKEQYKTIEGVTHMAGTSTRKTKRTAKKQGSRAFKDLKSMYCFKEMDDKIKAGVAVEEVARWLQEDMFQQTEIKRDSLVRKLYRYKASLPPAEIVTEPPLYVQKAVEKLKRGVNEVEEMEKLYLLQLKRISIDAQTEEKINKLFSSTNNEIRLAADLLSRMLEKKMDLGLVTKEPDRLDVSASFGIASVATEHTDEETKVKMGVLAGKVIDAMSRVLEEKERKKGTNDGSTDTDLQE